MEQSAIIRIFLCYALSLNTSRLPFRPFPFLSATLQLKFTFSSPPLFFTFFFSAKLFQAFAQIRPHDLEGMVGRGSGVGMICILLYSMPFR